MISSLTRETTPPTKKAFDPSTYTCLRFARIYTKSVPRSAQKPRNIACTAGRSGYKAWLQGDQAVEEGRAFTALKSKRLRHPVSDGLELPLGQAVGALLPIDACAADIPQHPGGR